MSITLFLTMLQNLSARCSRLPALQHNAKNCCMHAKNCLPRYDTHSSKIHAMIRSSVPMSGAGMSVQGPKTSFMPCTGRTHTQGGQAGKQRGSGCNFTLILVRLPQPYTRQCTTAVGPLQPRSCTLLAPHSSTAMACRNMTTAAGGERRACLQRAWLRAHLLRSQASHKPSLLCRQPCNQTTSACPGLPAATCKVNQPTPACNSPAHQHQLACEFLQLACTQLLR